LARGVAKRSRAPCRRTPGPTAAIPGDGDPRGPGTALGALWLLLDTAQRWRHGRALPDALPAPPPPTVPTLPRQSNGSGFVVTLRDGRVPESGGAPLMADLPAPCPQDRIGGQIVECVPLEDALRVRGVHPSAHGPPPPTRPPNL